MSDYKLKYKIISKLGCGGNGVVNKALCIKTGEYVALKELNDVAKKSKEKKFRFEDEITTMITAQKISGIIPILDYSKEDFWYVMPLAESIEKHCNSVDEIINGILQIAITLVKLHEIGLSHRDIKPDNMLFFNGRWVLCDFGLVDIPNNPHNITKNHTRIGAIKTIAPEMSRNPKNADGGKADVYSLAKSMWMLLTQTNDSFEGHYDVTDNSTSLHHFDKLRDKHLIEIDELLTSSTQNNPNERPTMIQFVDKLKNWEKIKSDIVKQQESNWRFLSKYLFYGNGPQRCVWADIKEIQKVLNLLSILPLYSHIFFPDNGWAEFKKVDLGSESSTLDIYTSLGIYRIKLGKLHYESFPQSCWNYFLLDAEPMSPEVGTEVDEYFERVVEDVPKHFVSAIDATYGVYSYDGGKKLPSESKLLTRCLKGKFLILMKYGPYNMLSQADDGRHNNCSNDEFRSYIEYLQKHYALNDKFSKEYIEFLDNCCFRTPPKLLKSTGIAPQNVKDFIRKNWLIFDFSDVIMQDFKMPIGKAKYGFIFHIPSGTDFLELLTSNTEYYLCKDGHIHKGHPNVLDIYEVTDRKVAITIFKELKDVLAKYCDGKVYDFDKPYFTVRITKVDNPKYLFTKNDIEKLMKEADDRKNNTLVIDEDGYPQIITDQFEAQFYPVVQETWCKRNNYVGKYSNLEDLTPSYHYSLGKWRDYLKKGYGQSMTDFDDYLESENELIHDIKKSMGI